MDPPTTLFFYSGFGKLSAPDYFFVRAISEHKLPEIGKGREPMGEKRLPANTPIGMTFDIAVLAPIFLRNMELISKTVPKDWCSYIAAVTQWRNRPWWTFRFPAELGGGRLCVHHDHVALLQDCIQRNT